MEAAPPKRPIPRTSAANSVAHRGISPSSAAVKTGYAPRNGWHAPCCFAALMSSKKLMRSAMVGFLLGVVVMTGVALMSRQAAREAGAQTR